MLYQKSLSRSSVRKQYWVLTKHKTTGAYLILGQRTKQFFLNNSNFNQLIIHKVSHKITNIKFHIEHTKGDVSSNFSSDLEKYK